MTVRTRFAPSPTGDLHIGGVRTALYCWLYARRHGGEFLLRVEDTDQQRSTDASIQVIFDSLAWLGLESDSAPVHQTQRLDRYKEVIAELLESGKAYYCFCSPDELNAMREAQMARGEKAKYDRTHRDAGVSPTADQDYVVRFKNPLDGEVVFTDAVYGEVRIANSELDDLIIQRSDGLPTYNFAVVVDDLDMQITHVIRGDDHINNTPRQINIFKALGAALPEFAHLPMILGADGQRLSKRHGAAGVLAYRDQGYLPEALLNYLVRLGWSHGDQEIFSVEEMCRLFDLDHVNRAAASFSTEKLDWINQQHLRNTDRERLCHMLDAALTQIDLDAKNGPPLADAVDAHIERATTITDLAEQVAVFYQPLQPMDEKSANKQLKPAAMMPLKSLKSRLEAVQHWTVEEMSQALHDTLDEHQIKFGKLGPPVRVAVTGSTKGPGVDQTLVLMGQERVLAGLDRAIAYINDKQ